MQTIKLPNYLILKDNYNLELKYNHSEKIVNNALLLFILFMDFREDEELKFNKNTGT